MFRGYLKTAIKSIQRVTSNLNNMKKDFDNFKTQTKINENKNFTHANKQKPDYLKTNPFYWTNLCKTKLKSFFSVDKTDNLLNSSSNNIGKINEAEGKLKNIVDKTKSTLTRVFSAVKALIITMKINEIVKVTINNLPIIIRKMSNSLVRISVKGKNYLVLIKNTALKKAEKYQDKEIKKNYEDYKSSINNSIINFSSKFKPLSEKIQKTSFFNTLNSFSMNNFRKFNSAVKDMNNMIASKGVKKKLYIYKFQMKEYLGNFKINAIYPFFKTVFSKFNLSSRFLKFKYSVIAFVLLIVSYKLSVLYSGYRQRKLSQKNLDEIYNLTMQLQKQNEEIIKKNENLNYLLEKEREKGASNFRL